MPPPSPPSPPSILPGTPYPLHLLDAAQASALARPNSKKVQDRRTFLESVINIRERLGKEGRMEAFGLEAAGGLSGVRSRVLPVPHLAYGAPECLFPGTLVSAGTGGLQLNHQYTFQS